VRGVNRDIFLRTLCLVAVNLYFTSAGARQGAMILAVNTLMMQLYLLFSYFLDGFAFAGEALAGRYYGAGDRDSLRQVVRCLFGWGGLMVVLFTQLYWLGGDAFLQLLTSDDSVVRAASQYYAWALLIPLCGMAAFVWDGIYIGLTLSRGMLWACFIAALVFFAVWFALSPVWGNHALWLALLLFLLVRGIVQTVLYNCRSIVRRRSGDRRS
jgi:MATE family multidrug resistance protein